MTFKEETKALWECCFEDSPEFVDYYFHHRYKEEINRTIVREGKVVSALQAIPYEMTYGETMIKTSYISGACTHPDFRSQGSMRQLLNETHQWMFQQGVQLSTLIPATPSLFGYYAALGYVPLFTYTRQQVLVKDLHLSLFYTIREELFEEEYRFDQYHYMKRMMRRRPSCIQHSREDFKIIVGDLQLAKGSLWVARKANQITGMAFCVKSEGKLTVNELLFDNEMVRDSLLAVAAAWAEVDALTWLCPAVSEGAYLGMARLIQVEEMLALFASLHPEKEMYLQVEGDETIPENNGYYIIQHGKCRREYLPERPYQHCTLAELTRILFDGENASMSLMLN